MPQPQPLDLDALDAVIRSARAVGADITPETAAALADEIRRLRAELATAREQAIQWAAETIDAKLAAEPDHNRASALYELLLHLRGELPCTCARSQGLHEKHCRRYVPGHELLSPVRALAVYRSERAAVEAHVVAEVRIKTLTAEADEIVAHCPDHGSRDGVWMGCHCAVADDMRRRAAAVSAAAQAQQDGAQR
jgi:hypothetical protein